MHIIVIDFYENVFSFTASVVLGPFVRRDCGHSNKDDSIRCCWSPSGVSEVASGLRCERPTRPRKQEAGSALHMRSVVAISHDTELRLSPSGSSALFIGSPSFVDAAGWSSATSPRRENSVVEIHTSVHYTGLHEICSWLPPFCKPNLLLFIQPRWQLRRTYFFNHYNVLF